MANVHSEVLKRGWIFRKVVATRLTVDSCRLAQRLPEGYELRVSAKHMRLPVEGSTLLGLTDASVCIDLKLLLDRLYDLGGVKAVVLEADPRREVLVVTVTYDEAIVYFNAHQAIEDNAAAALRLA